MTLEEAIKRQATFVKKTEGYFDDEDIQAAKLGIEALKRIQDARDIQPESACADSLPGETSEKEG